MDPEKYETAEDLKLEKFLNGEWVDENEPRGVISFEPPGQNWFYVFLGALRNIRNQRELDSGGKPCPVIEVMVTLDQQLHLLRGFLQYCRQEDFKFVPPCERAGFGLNCRSYRFVWPAALELKVYWKGD